MNEQQVFEAVFKATGVSDFQKAAANAQQAMSDLDKVGGELKNIGKGMMKSVTAPIVAMGTGIMMVGKEYEASMSQVAAISGATGEELDRLKETAREMGATTRYSASESADALGYMALAGWDVEQMTSALPGVLNLATAGAMDLALASDIVTDTMSMFGMEATEAGRASDIFAAAQSKSNTNVEQLSEALLNAGPAAAAAGADLEQTSAILGIFANQGVKGGRAGTALNAMFRDIKASAEDGAIAIGEHSISVYDASGNMRAMGDIMADVEKATSGMTTEQRDSALAGVFQQQSLSGVNLLLAEGSEALKDLENDIYNSDGVAQNMADTMDDNLSGALANMRSALEEVALGFYDMAGGPMTTIIQKITELFQWFGNLSDETKQWIGIIALTVAALGPLIWLVGSLATGIAGIPALLALLAGPVGAVIAGIVAVVAVGALLIANWESIKETISSVWAVIQEVFMTIAQPLMDWFEENQEKIRATVSSVWEKIEEVVTTVVNAVSDVVTSVWESLTSFWVNNNELIGNTVETIWNTILTVITTVIRIIEPVVVGAWNAISTVTTTVWGVISTTIETTMNVILGIIETVMKIITGDWEGAWDSMKDTVSEVISGVTDVINTLRDIDLWGAGKAIIDGFLGGLKETWEAGKKFISGIGGWIRDNKGPISYDKKLLIGAGEAIIGGLNKGLQDSFVDVQKTISGMAGAINQTMFNGPSVNINGTLARSNAQVKSTVSHEINRNQSATQPAYINVNIGGQNFRGFVENISNEQGRITDLELQF